MATTDEGIIRNWFKDHPDANVAIATGEASKLLVIDVDCGAGKVGFETLEKLEFALGPLPRALTVRTGSGGLHVYVKMPGYPVGCSAGKIGEDIDVRANGGYVVAPPSNHISGNQYEWNTSNEQ